MERLQSNNINMNNNSIDNDMWNVIEHMNWGENTYKLGKKANDEVAVYCIDNLSLDEISDVLNFVVNKRNILMNKTKESIKKGEIKLNSNGMFLSDDTIWDICSHVVGLGQETYNKVLNNISEIVNYSNSAIENFEYGFDKAIYELHK